MSVDERDHVFDRRSSSPTAKYADPLCRISFAYRNSRFSRSSAFSGAAGSVGKPARLPASTSVRLIHFLSVCAVQPIFAATGVIAAQRDVCSCS
jgi:hypothetical protein